jgi:hypothetical protein
MALAALIWVNIDASSYDAVWGARLSVRLAGGGVSLDLREWVNSGLMTFFFVVVVFGLEARREFDMGELRERRRLALPVAAGLGGLVIPVAIYLAVNAGSPAAHFPRSSVIRRHAPVTPHRRSPGRGGPPQFPPPPSIYSAPYAGESFTAALPGSAPLPWPSPCIRGARHSLSQAKRCPPAPGISSVRKIRRPVWQTPSA